MPISLAHVAEPFEEICRRRFRALTGHHLVCLVPLGGGGNSRVYRAVCNGAVYAVKQYYTHPLDSRDRLGTEFAALTLLWEHGIRCVPQPLAMDRQLGFAVYRYITGTPVPAHAVTYCDIDAAVAFLRQLKTLWQTRAASPGTPASEACFSAAALVANIEQRLQRLLALGQGDSYAAALQAFLQEAFIPAFHAIAAWCARAYASAGLAFAAPIPESARTLSPSDFGFHNAIRTPENSLVFLDFEYFGVDDPAKLICDFLLHPGMRLTEDLKKYFLAAALGAFHDQPRLRTRVALLYPLFGLKWCLILLNEFIPVDAARRLFATGGRSEDRRAQQLLKAQRLLRSITHAYPCALSFI